MASAGASASGFNPTFPVPVFPNTVEWWNPAVWQEAMDIMATITEETSFEDVKLRTGTGFWLRAMARFPVLQLVALRHESTFFKRKSGKKIAKEVPGLGWEIQLQEFRLADTSAVGGTFAAANREDEDAVLVTVLYYCNQKGCSK